LTGRASSQAHCALVSAGLERQAFSVCRPVGLSLVEESLRLGAEHYFVKPIDFHKLSQVTPKLGLNWALCRTPVAFYP